MKRSILVTGAGGFIGSHLCQVLISRGYRVVGVDLRYPRNHMHGRPEDYQAVTGDFRNQEMMKELLNGVDIVFHLASAHLQVNLPESEYWSVNVHSLRPLMEMASKSGVRRFVHVSTVGIYGDLKTWPADEETRCEPQNIYSATKQAGEAVVKKYHEETGLPVVILRPAWVYGPGCPRTLKIYRTLRKGRFIMIGKGGNRRHPIYIRDMLAAFVLVIEAGSAVGETFIIGGSNAFSTAELVASFCNVFNLAGPKIRLPMSLGKIAVSGAELIFRLTGKEPPVSRRSLEFFNTNNAFDISKAERLLGFHPAYTFEEGLEDSREWLESHFSS